MDLFSAQSTTNDWYKFHFKIQICGEFEFEIVPPLLNVALFWNGLSINETFCGILRHKRSRNDSTTFVICAIQGGFKIQIFGEFERKAFPKSECRIVLRRIGHNRNCLLHNPAQTIGTIFLSKYNFLVI